jgi:class I fructose-bisphosphate aldolase
MMDTSAIEKNGKIYLIAYDQGLEHGPARDFNKKNAHPNYIFRIASEGNASCVAMHYGMAKRYYTRELQREVPLILKVNGKTSLYSGNYLSAVTANIEDALNVGAVGIGFTIFPGQEEEQFGFEQFAEMRRIAEQEGLITVLWSYARGPEIEDQHDKDVVAYAIRTAAELGADVAKVKYSGDPESFSWAIEMGGGIKVLASGTDNFGEDYVSEVGQLVKSGATGLAVGRKVWQHDDAINFSKEVAAKIYNS